MNILMMGRKRNDARSGKMAALSIELDHKCGLLYI